MAYIYARSGYTYTRTYTIDYTNDYVGKDSTTDGAIAKLEAEQDLLITQVNKMLPSGNSSAITFDNISPAKGQLFYYDSSTGQYVNRYQSVLMNQVINSSFGFWSNSTLAQGTTGRQTDFNVSNIWNDDCADNGTGDYTLTDCTMAQAAGIYTITSTANTAPSPSRSIT